MARVELIDTKEGLTPDQEDAFEEIAASRGHVVGPFRALLHRPELARRVSRLGALVRFESGLDGALLELAILTIARNDDAQFEWTAHLPLALKAGVREEAVAAVRDRTAPAGLVGDEVTVWRFVHEVLADKRIAEDTYRAALDLFGLDGVFALTAVAGYYGLLSAFMNAFEIEPAPGVDPLVV
jgi:4-carboxymuconolactone decarboxylase